MYKFVPIVKTLIWGTERWVLSGVPGSESVVAEGPDAGRSINELREIWSRTGSVGIGAAKGPGSPKTGTRLAGTPGGSSETPERSTAPVPEAPERFPLLVKFLDARQDLSIQVHPNDELAARRHGSPGKSEMWYVTGADPGARLLCGFKEQVDPSQYAELVETGRIADTLASYEVAPGDVFYLPAGRVHAICGGCRVAEIQQTSDLTYRMYDYGRLGLDGKPRQLHTELAREAIDYTVLPDYRTHYTRRPDEQVELVSCPYFTTGLLELTRPMELAVKEDGAAFLILMGISGEVHIDSPGDSLTLGYGEAILVPAAEAPLHLTPLSGSVTLLTTHP